MLTLAQWVWDKNAWFLLYITHCQKLSGTDTQETNGWFCTTVLVSSSEGLHNLLILPIKDIVLQPHQNWFWCKIGTVLFKLSSEKWNSLANGINLVLFDFLIVLY